MLSGKRAPDLAAATFPTILAERVCRRSKLELGTEANKARVRETVPYYQAHNPASWDRLILQKALQRDPKTKAGTFRERKFAQDLSEQFAQVPERIGHYLWNHGWDTWGQEEVESVTLTAYAVWLFLFTDRARELPDLPVEEIGRMYGSKRGRLGGFLRKYAWQSLSKIPSAEPIEEDYPDPYCFEADVEDRIFLETVVQSSLENLSDTLSSVLIRRLRGQSVKRISEELGVERHAVSMRIHRGTEKLKEILK